MSSRGQSLALQRPKGLLLLRALLRERACLPLIVLGAVACSQEAAINTSQETEQPRDAGGRRPVMGADAGPGQTVESRDGGEPAATPHDGGKPAANPSVDESAVQQVAAALEVTWQDCSLHTGVPIGERPGVNTEDAGAALEPVVTAECAIVQLPLRWREPSGEQLDWFVKRIPAALPARGQIWLLQGGPGAPGVGMEYIARDLHDLVPDLDVYIPDHRGVGRSTLFECPEALRPAATELSQIVACGDEVQAEWGANTAEFSTTAAARDVLAVATHLHQTGDEVILHGTSYGGYWAHRALQVDQRGLFTAAVLDSSALPSGGLSTLHEVLRPAEAGNALLELCAADDVCHERLGDDPEQRALQIMDQLCTPVSGRGGRNAVQALISAALREWRLLRLIPAILYRIERCTEEDVAYVDAYAAQLSGQGEPEPAEAPASRALFTLVAYSEIVTEFSETTTIIEASANSVFSDLLFATNLESALERWPLYPANEYTGQWLNTNAKLLVLHGGLDTQTPPSTGRAIAEHFTAAGQQYFFFPTGGHGLYYRTHRLADDDAITCGQHITFQFLKDPSSPIDGSCIDAGPPLDFAGPDDLLLELAGHTDPWDYP